MNLSKTNLAPQLGRSCDLSPQKAIFLKNTYCLATMT